MKIRLSGQALRVNVLYILLLADVLYIFPQTLYLGLVSLIITLLLPLIYTIREGKFRRNTFAIVFVFIAYGALLLTKSGFSVGIYNYLLQVLIVLFITCFENVSLDRVLLHKLCFGCELTAYILIVYNLFLLSFESQLGIVYRGFPYAMRPVLFGMMLLSLYSNDRSKKSLYIKLLVFSAFMFLFTERTQSLGLLLFILFHALFTKVQKIGIKRMVFMMYCCFIALIPALFISLYKSNYSYKLNQIVAEYTHKNLFSGRQELWSAAINKISYSPITGHGYGEYIFNYGERAMSVHNTYLYMTLQGGIIGFLLVIALFFFLFNKMINKPKSYERDLSMALLPVVMFLASFGLIMFANNILYSVFLWIGIGIGLMKLEEG